MNRLEVFVPCVDCLIKKLKLLFSDIKRKEEKTKNIPLENQSIIDVLCLVLEGKQEK
jgi:hypothetical protein